MPDPNGQQQASATSLAGSARWVMIPILLGLALRLAFMAASLQENPVTSDEALQVLLAKAIAGGELPLYFMDQPYQFPLASYLSAPLVSFLPRTALGARHLCFLLGLATFGGQILLARRLTPGREAWPAILLASLPSSYLLTLQAGYSPPNYETMLFFWVLVFWLALRQRGKTGLAGSVLAGACGLASGLAFSAHPLALSLLIPAGLSVCLDRGWRQALRKAPAYAMGLAMGLLPFVLGERLHAGASAHVINPRGLASALSLGFAKAAGHALSGALGFFTVSFPDFGEEIHLWTWLEAILLWLFLLALVAASLLSLKDIAKRSWWLRWPSLEPLDIFPWACWLGLGMFALNERANSGQFRYLLVTTWSLPFLAAFLWPRARGWRRGAMALVVAALALLNLTSGVFLVASWNRPGYVARQSACPDLGPIIEALDREGVKHCYAAHWTAARLTFLTDERIVCTQPFNQRFRDWPMRYKERVDQDQRAAYVLTSPDSFDAKDFERVLAEMGAQAREVKADGYHIYLDFRWRPGLEGERVPPQDLVFSASHQSEQSASLGQGGGWSSGQPQQKGMWLKMDLARALPLNRLLIRYPSLDPYHLPRAYRLLARENGKWRLVLEEAEARLDDFEMVNEHPVWDQPTQSWRFAPILADALRLEVRHRGNPVAWSLAGVEVYFQPGPDR